MTSHSLLPQPDNNLDTHVASVFRSLCARIDPKDITQIRHQVLAHCDMIRAELRRNEFLDIDLAQRIADVILVLLDDYATFSDGHRLLIAGAAHYFVHSDDADPM